MSDFAFDSPRLQFEDAFAASERYFELGWTDGLLRWPSSVCSDGRGGLYVADRENNRIAVFSEMP